MKKFGLLILVVLIIVLSQLISNPLYFNKKLSEKIIRDLLFDINTSIFNNNFNHKFNINIDSINILEDMKKVKNVDILMANHYSSVDFMLIFYLLNCVKRKDIILLFKKELLYIPIVSNLLDSDNYMKINRSWDKDKDFLEKYINKLKSGIIIIFPEGTRYSRINYEKSKKYCTNNKLICNKKLLIPRVKGLFNIISILKKNNKMGNLYDLSSVVPEIMENFDKIKFDYIKLFSTDLSESYHYLSKITIPNYYEDYDIFKNWLYHQWNTKDFFINNYKNYKYKQLLGKYSKKNILKCYVMIIVYIYLIKNYPYHTTSNFILFYSLTLFKTLLN